ncbi:MAG: hypothetical protein AAGA31_05685 [Bacteroidota bacterium]
MEVLKETLIALGVSSDAIDALTAEDKPEGFDQKEYITNLVTEREEFYLTKFKPQIESEYKDRTEKERYAATIKPIQSRIDKQLKDLGATPEQIKEVKGDVGVDPKKGIELIGKLAAKGIQSASVKTESEALTKALEEVDKWKTEASQRTEEIEVLKQTFEADKTKLEKEYEQKEVNRNKSRHFSEVLSGEAFDGVKKIGDIGKVMKMYIDEYGYDIRPSEDGKSWKVVSTDGTAAISIDGKRTYKGVEEMMVDVARQKHLFPEHNGGKDRKVGTHERIIDGKKVNTGGASFLADALAD